MKRRVLLSTIALGVAGLLGEAGAEDYPSRPVTIVVPFAAGGPTDTSARIVAQALTKSSGNSFIVQNVPGAGAVIGATKVAQSEPDGYTVLWGSGSSLAMTPHVNDNVKYDPVKSFTPIGQVVAQPFVLVVKPGLAVKTIGELVEKIKAQPGKFNFASAGTGSSTHLVAELFSAASGTKATHVPYKGGAPAINAVVGGEVDYFFDTPTTVVPLAKAGRVDALATTSTKRWPALPEVPTMQESGFAGFDATTWFGMVAPRGLPADRVAYLSKHLLAVLEEPEVISSLEAGGFLVEPSKPEPFARKIASEFERWGKIVREANIKL
jgi:tripartite-type tricarboxylate transporter receptor subunit TctC